MALSAGLAVAAMAVGLTGSYLVPTLPPSTTIVGAAALTLAASFSWPRPQVGHRPPGRLDQSPASRSS